MVFNVNDEGKLTCAISLNTELQSESERSVWDRSTQACAVSKLGYGADMVTIWLKISYGNVRRTIASVVRVDADDNRGSRSEANGRRITATGSIRDRDGADGVGRVGSGSDVQAALSLRNRATPTQLYYGCCMLRPKLGLRILAPIQLFHCQTSAPPSSCGRITSG